MLYDKNVATFMLQLCYDKNSRQALENHRPETCNFIKEETLAQVFSYEFCKIYKNAFYYRIPLVAVSAQQTCLEDVFNTSSALQFYVSQVVLKTS